MKAFLDFMSAHWKRISAVGMGLLTLWYANPPHTLKEAIFTGGAFILGIATPDKMLAAKIQGEEKP